MIGCVFRFAKPAPLILANRACYMIASGSFFNRDFALLTLLKVLIPRPREQLTIHCLVTILIWVICHATFRAYVLVTISTCFFNWILRLTTDEPTTFPIWTPVQKGVFTDFLIKPKFFVFEV